MSEATKIEWCDMTWNPWEGCTKVSPGCANCYAEARNARWAGGVAPNWGNGAPRRRTSPGNWRLPLKWNEQALAGRFVACHVCGRREFRKWDARVAPGGLSVCSGFASGCLSLPESDSTPVRPRVFCSSLADWLDDEVPLEWLVDLLNIINITPHLDWLLLTKRPHRWSDRIRSAADWLEKHDSDGKATGSLWVMLKNWLGEMGGPSSYRPANVWIGASVEDQRRAVERIPALLQVPARVRFLSCEPLLGPVNLAGDGLRNWDLPFAHPGSRVWPLINWVIVGGESGNGARPMALEWADDLRRQCTTGGVPFFMKQLGSAPCVENANLWDWPLTIDEEKIYGPPPPGVEAAAAFSVRLRDRKGGDMECWPDALCVREWPRPERGAR